MKIGIIGAGQLGLMLGEAAKKLNYECIFLDPNKNSPAKKIGKVINQEFSDIEGIRRLDSLTDVITYEFENVPVESINTLNPNTVFPSSKALEIAQDRLKEKQLFDSLNIPVARYMSVNTKSDLLGAKSSLGFPFILKTRRFGYDGKGQSFINDEKSLNEILINYEEMDLIAEKKIDFNYEISAIGARNTRGESIFYPLTHNTHKNGILRTSRTINVNESISKQAFSYLSDLLSKLDYVGVIALELFVKNDHVIANEYAPRVHNSGHWTIEGAKTSQFENHLRAILNMKLGDTSEKGFVGMENLIGTIPSDIQQLKEDFFLHDYGKTERPGRKLGHISVIGEDKEEREEKLRVIQKIISN